MGAVGTAETGNWTSTSQFRLRWSGRVSSIMAANPILSRSASPSPVAISSLGELQQISHEPRIIPGQRASARKSSIPISFVTVNPEID